jgi:hypothetical protein
MADEKDQSIQPDPSWIPLNEYVRSTREDGTPVLLRAWRTKPLDEPKEPVANP